MAEEGVLHTKEDISQFVENEMANIITIFNDYRQNTKTERWVLTQEGEIFAKYGSAEVLLFSAVPPEGVSREDLRATFTSMLPDSLEETFKSFYFKIGSIQAIKNKWVEFRMSGVSRNSGCLEYTRDRYFDF